MDPGLQKRFEKNGISVEIKEKMHSYQICSKAHPKSPQYWILNVYTSGKKDWQGKPQQEQFKREVENLIDQIDVEPVEKHPKQEKMESSYSLQEEALSQIKYVENGPFKGLRVISDEEAISNSKIDSKDFFARWEKLKDYFYSHVEELIKSGHGPWVAIIESNQIISASTMEEVKDRLDKQNIRLAYVGKVEKGWKPQRKEILVTSVQTDTSQRPHCRGMIQLNDGAIRTMYLLDTGSEAPLCIKSELLAQCSIRGSEITASSIHGEIETPSAMVRFAFEGCEPVHEVKAISNYLNKPLVGMPIISHYNLNLPKFSSGQSPTLTE